MSEIYQEFLIPQGDKAARDIWEAMWYEEGKKAISWTIEPWVSRSVSILNEKRGLIRDILERIGLKKK